jgi:hypothetical protein
LRCFRYLTIERSMIKARKFCKLSACLSKYLAGAAASVTLIACETDAPAEKEIFIEAIPRTSSSFSSAGGTDKKSQAIQPIQLSFDHSAYFMNATSSFLYRGEYLSYIHDQGHLDAGSVLVENRTASWQGPLLTLPPLDEGVPYNASVWVRLIDTEEQARVKLILSRVSEGTVTNLLLNEIQAEPRMWQKVEGEFVGNAQSDSDINALSLEVEGTGKYLIDDILVTHADESAKAAAATLAATSKGSVFVINGSVEDGLDPWTHQGGIISRSTYHAHTGKHSLLISGRRQEWNAPMMFIKGLKDHKSYRFSIFARLNEGQQSANVRLTLRRTTAGQTAFTALGASQATSSNWTEVAATFSSPNISESEKISVYLECEDPLASYFVDTLTIEEVPAK